jgi:hypothetical protein
MGKDDIGRLGKQEQEMQMKNGNSEKIRPIEEKYERGVLPSGRRPPPQYSMTPPLKDYPRRTKVQSRVCYCAGVSRFLILGKFRPCAMEWPAVLFFGL